MGDNHSAETFDDNEFGKELVEYIQKDAALKLLYDRLKIECEVVVKVIERLISNQISAEKLAPLKQINTKFPDSKNTCTKLSTLDRSFHETLSRLADDDRIPNMYIEGMLDDQDSAKTWQSIRANKKHSKELDKIHVDIVRLIEEKNSKEALKAMRKHFIIVLPHYVQQTHASQ